ncbi:hypothetical protein PENTCL1PPCAC_4305, partial [Pristionchus entomophagus]
ATWSGFSLPSNKGNHKIAAYRIGGVHDSIVSYRFKEKIDGGEVPVTNRKAKYACISCERSTSPGTKATIRVFFPDDDQAVFLSNPADPSRHRCDWNTDEKCRPAVVLSTKIAKDFSVKNSECAADGHLKNPSRAYMECSDVDEVLDLYSGGKNKNKRKRQISLYVKKATGVSRVEKYDKIDDKDIQILGLSETYRISDPSDSKRIYLA